MNDPFSRVKMACALKKVCGLERGGKQMRMRKKGTEKEADGSIWQCKPEG